MRMEVVMREWGREVLRRASKEYGFKLEEAYKKCVLGEGVSVSCVKRERSEVPLPYTGMIEERDCKGIKYNHGLHTQCVKEKVSGEEYCLKCIKEAKKNASGKPNYGDIRDRERCEILEFRDAKGKKTIPYANVVKKMGLNKEECIREARLHGVVIPECHWIERKSQRGRPKKKKEEVKKSGSDVKRKVREKSVKKTDLLAALEEATKCSEVSSIKSVEEDEIICEKFVHEGVVYLRSGNIIIDAETHKEVGVWDEKMKMMVMSVESDDEKDKEEIDEDELSEEEFSDDEN